MKSVHLAVPVSDFFGAGVCGKYLFREFAKRMPTVVHLQGESVSDGAAPTSEPLAADISLPLIQFTGPLLESQTKYRGDPHVGYTFFETPILAPQQVLNAAEFDVLAAGSTWNRDVLAAYGVESIAIPQGVNTEIFKPAARKDDGRFVIFSAGKWEPRKAQDLVLKAVRALQDRHADIDLHTLWFNPWTMKDGSAEALAAGVRMTALKPCYERELPAYMHATDIGLFPNRCEGGTNLFLMDYMACGRPVIANDSTGQRDVLGGHALRIRGKDDWLVEQMVEGVEMLYRNRERMAQMGTRAGDVMREFSWSRTVDWFVRAVDAEQVAVAA